VRIGEDAIATQNDALLDTYYTEDYALHSPAGDFNRDEIKAYFAALRESFADFTIRRAQILVDGNYVSARTIMAGRFDSPSCRRSARSSCSASSAPGSSAPFSSHRCGSSAGASAT
jgi:SnoaL-like domain